VSPVVNWVIQSKASHGLVPALPLGNTVMPRICRCMFGSRKPSFDNTVMYSRRNESNWEVQIWSDLDSWSSGIWWKCWTMFQTLATPWLCTTPTYQDIAYCDGCDVVIMTVLNVLFRPAIVKHNNCLCTCHMANSANYASALNLRKTWPAAWIYTRSFTWVSPSSQTTRYDGDCLGDWHHQQPIDDNPAAWLCDNSKAELLPYYSCQDSSSGNPRNDDDAVPPRPPDIVINFCATGWHGCCFRRLWCSLANRETYSPINCSRWTGSLFYECIIDQGNWHTSFLNQTAHKICRATTFLRTYMLTYILFCAGFGSWS